MPTEQLPADAFTKALPRNKLVHHLEALGFEFSSSGSSGSVGDGFKIQVGKLGDNMERVKKLGTITRK